MENIVTAGGKLQIGQPFSWSTIGGESYTGVIEDIDSNVLIVRLPDGTTKSVEM